MLTRVRRKKSIWDWDSDDLDRSGNCSLDLGAATAPLKPPDPLPRQYFQLPPVDLRYKYPSVSSPPIPLLWAPRLSPADIEQAKLARQRRYLIFKPTKPKGESLNRRRILRMARPTPDWLKTHVSPITIEEYRKICVDALASLNREQGSYDLNDDSLWKIFTVGFRVCVLTLDTLFAEFEGCDVCEEMECICSKFSAEFMRVVELIKELKLVEEITGPYLLRVLRKQIELYVERTCLGNYETQHLPLLRNWLHRNIMPWVRSTLNKFQGGRLLDQFDSKTIASELEVILLEVLGRTVIQEMFSVIIEYPESQPILDDMRVCMRHATLRNPLVAKLKSDLKRRLLNTGVTTTDVLEAYVATVRALKYLDTTGILVQLVTPPVREYLKQRKETVRVILVSLTEESGDLAEELARNPAKTDKKTLLERSWKKWIPDPIDVPKDKHNLRKGDLIQALISIYGSKSLFIDEYRALLADRLLKMTKLGSITREIKCLELLKLRFGDSDLQRCEVMLKDVSDSHRMNTRFLDEGSALTENFPVSGLIVSAQFWPTFKQEALVLPEAVIRGFEKYTKAFEVIKGNRSLEWQKHIGHVEIEIEHMGSTLQLTVSPPLAIIIWQFQEKDTWNLEDLSQATGMVLATLRSRISFWVSKGVLAQGKTDTFHLQDTFNVDNPQATGVSANLYTEEEDLDSPMTSTSTQREAELQMFWSYIEGMLTNLESLPLSRIHSMLKLFATVECSLEELQKFLDAKVSSGSLVYSGGQYQLPK